MTRHWRISRIASSPRDGVVLVDLTHSQVPFADVPGSSLAVGADNSASKMSREIGQAKKIPRVAATTPVNTGSCDPGTRSGLCLCAARARVALPGDPVRGGHGPAAPVGRTVQHAAPFLSRSRHSHSHTRTRTRACCWPPCGGGLD